jgi:2-amino-4-hydroxy-6-hydroxymethyldihydropteridine diphosphokinase
METTHKCYLLLGSNQGNRVDTLDKALREIRRKIGPVEKYSSLYETEAWGFESENAFLNRVAVVSTALTALEVLKTVLEIETGLGRVRHVSDGYVSRIIDIDILFFDNEIIDLPELKIPHPKLHLRMFTLVPLTEICPEKVHPVLGKTVSELRAGCKDELSVRKITESEFQTIKKKK